VRRTLAGPLRPRHWLRLAGGNVVALTVEGHRDGVGPLFC
jgi:hypothetical protein